MKKEKRKEPSMAIFYLFLILFFGWILTQFILINQNSLIINNNEITGLALQIDPVGSLGSIFNYEINLGGDLLPMWALLIAFGIIMSIMYNATGLLNFFQGEERRGSRIIISLGITAAAVFATSIVKSVIILASYVGSLGSIVILLLIAGVIYLYTHQTLRDRIREVWPPGGGGRGGAGQVGGGGGQQARQPQAQAQRPGLVRRGEQQPQQLAQRQQITAQQIKHRLLQNYYIRMQTAHQQTLREINNANPNLNNITGYLTIIRDGSRGVIADLTNSALTGAVVNQVISLARSINTSSDRMLRIRDVRQLSINYRRGNNMRNWIVNLGRVINNL